MADERKGGIKIYELVGHATIITNFFWQNVTVIIIYSKVLSSIIVKNIIYFIC